MNTLPPDLAALYGRLQFPAHPLVHLSGVPGVGSLSAQAIAQAVCRERQCSILLVEGGPQVLGAFLAEQVLDELFLTLSPQIAGRDNTAERPGLVTGKLFAPETPLWGTLISVKQGRNHLFLRYAFETKEAQYDQSIAGTQGAGAKRLA